MKKKITLCAALLFMMLLVGACVSVNAAPKGIRVREEFYFEDTYTYSMTYPGLKAIYKTNLPRFDENTREYFWGFDFTDGKKRYTIGTFHYHVDEGPSEMTLGEMQSELWLHRGQDMGWCGDAELKIEGDKLSWTFDVPRDFDNNNFKITRIYTQIMGKYTFDESVPKKSERWENPLKAKGNKCYLKESALKTKKRLITANAAITIPDAEGTVSYQMVTGSPQLTLNKKTGFITVAKGTEAGTYTMKVRVRAKGNDWYAPKDVYVRVTVIVKK